MVGALIIISPKGLIVLKGLACIVPKVGEGVILPGYGSPELHSPKGCYLVRYIRKGLDKLASKVLDFSRAGER